MERTLVCPVQPVPAERLRVILYGVGAIGKVLAKRVLEQGTFDVTGAVDPDPEKAGRWLSDVVDSSQPGPKIVSSLKDVNARADVVIHMAGSRMPQVEGHLVEILKRGLSCVSSCEELCFPAPPPRPRAC